MQATCPAHQVIIDLFSDPEYGQCDPVPAECAKWLRSCSGGAAASFAGNAETGELMFGPAESSPETFEGEQPEAMYLRGVECNAPKGTRDESYHIYTYGRNKLCVFFVIYSPCGHPCWSRIDLVIAGW